MEELKILIVGQGNVATSKSFSPKKDNEVVLIDGESFYIDGVKYVPIKSERRKHAHVNSKMNEFMTAMAAATMIYAPYMSDIYGLGQSNYERKLPEGTNIIKEYALIQNKKSSLSKKERDMVVFIFERNFSKVD